MPSETQSRRERHDLATIEYTKKDEEITEGHRRLDQQKQELKEWYEAIMQDIYQ